jgi:hypothetical protein
MESKWDGTKRTVGVPEDRTREQFAATIMRHPAGKPGHVYVAQVLAEVRADTLTELQASVADFAWDATNA